MNREPGTPSGAFFPATNESVELGPDSSPDAALSLGFSIADAIAEAGGAGEIGRSDTAVEPAELPFGPVESLAATREGTPEPTTEIAVEAPTDTPAASAEPAKPDRQTPPKPDPAVVAALEACFRNQRTPLLTAALGQIFGPDRLARAEEVLNAAAVSFLQTYGNTPDRIKDESTVLSLLRTIITRRLADQHRKNYKLPEYSTDDLPDKRSTRSAEDEVLSTHALEEATHALPPMQANLLDLLLDNPTQSSMELAGKLNSSSGSVRVALHRLRAHLKSHLVDQDPGVDDAPSITEKRPEPGRTGPPAPLKFVGKTIYDIRKYVGDALTDVRKSGVAFHQVHIPDYLFPWNTVAADLIRYFNQADNGRVAIAYPHRALLPAFGAYMTETVKHSAYSANLTARRPWQCDFVIDTPERIEQHKDEFDLDYVITTDAIPQKTLQRLQRQTRFLLQLNTEYDPYGQDEENTEVDNPLRFADLRRPPTRIAKSWQLRHSVLYLQEANYFHGTPMTEARAEQLAASGLGPAVGILCVSGYNFASLTQLAGITPQNP